LDNQKFFGTTVVTIAILPCLGIINAIALDSDEHSCLRDRNITAHTVKKDRKVSSNAIAKPTRSSDIYQARSLHQPQLEVSIGSMSQSGNAKFST
jgi:hypothetical protein